MASDSPPLPEGVNFSQTNACNGVSIHAKDGHSIAIYRPADGETSTAMAILLTHARREMISELRPISKDTRLFAPRSVKDLLQSPKSYWTQWWDKRFDYYDQQVTRLPVMRQPASGHLAEGEHLEFGDLSVEVLSTPGVTREGLTFLVEVGGKRLAFTGNLILHGGKVPDLYSFQDAIRDAKVGAYHGYCGRFGPWIESLEKILAKQPDFLIPCNGPVIGNPPETIDLAIARARSIYANYLSTNALHWYFGEERMRTCADKVLGPDVPMESMPLANHIDLPSWVQHIGTTKLLLSKDRTGFALDVGSPSSLQTLKQVVADGLVTKIEGIWVTHRHNDHTQAVRDAQEAFDCPVYAVKGVADALTEPGAHFSPGISRNAVKRVTTLKDGEAMSWREFDFTARFFPGQMLDHGGLLVTPKDSSSDPVFFIGDSFSPSGIDDYCLMNRNLMREDLGYLKCLSIVRNEIPKNAWLVNQHIPHLFRFSPKELDFLEGRYRERMAMIAEFTPWDDINYAVDEQWAWLSPYGQEVRAGEAFSLDLRITNYSPAKRQFTVKPSGNRFVIMTENTENTVSIESHANGVAKLSGKIADSCPPGVQVVTVSLKSEGWDLPHWCEALIKVVE
ncbi:MAG: MBL fold metallo-hydrolase [Verrucomicrobiae bacterium]|nr:MBL fold metallo-hydrolase [Verrucomicrobiae bacterium]